MEGGVSFTPDRLSESQRDFRNVVWPAVADLCGGGTIVAVESVAESGFQRDLDVMAGIDAWHMRDNRQMRGIASRVQRPPHRYASFTVRSSLSSGGETEASKRLDALNDAEWGGGWLTPALTIQGYVDEDCQLVGAGCVQTSDLYALIEAGRKGHEYQERSAPGGNYFYVVWWSTLRLHDVCVRTVGEHRLVDKSSRLMGAA